MDWKVWLVQSLQSEIQLQQEYMGAKTVGSESRDESLVELSQVETNALLRIWEAHGRCDVRQINFEQAIANQAWNIPVRLESFAPPELVKMLEKAIADREDLDWESWEWVEDWDWAAVVDLE